MTVLAAVATGALLLGCSTKVRPYRCDELTNAAPQAVWSCHRDIMRRAARGKPFTLEEFRRAVEFFEDLTGIRADTVPTPVGVVPGRSLRKDLRRWDEWFDDNADRLSWDPRRGVVVDG